MTPERQAVSWAFARYNDDLEFRQATVEIGNVLGADRLEGTLRPGANVPGPHGAQVQPYSAGGLALVLNSYAGQGDVFMGDYHCHVNTGASWTDHVPSDSDVTHLSCLCDLWPLNPPLMVQGVQVTFLETAPRFQLVQANAFGDIFLVTPSPSRPRFQTLAAQQQTMTAIARAYATWHMIAHARLGALPVPLRHREFLSTIGAELPAMNAALGGRGRIELLRNWRYVSDDDPDFLE